MTDLQGIESSVECGDGLSRCLRVAIKAEVLEREVEARLQAVGRSVALKGYRPGKTPRQVLQQRFGDQVRREVTATLVQSSLTEAIRQQNLRPVGEAKIDAPEIGKGTDLRYSATFEVLPDIELAGLDSIPIERPEPAIDEEDVEFAIEALRRQQARWSAVSRPAQSGDRVTVNSSVPADGQQVEGISGDGVQLVLGEGQFLAEMEREIIGMSAGEERAVSVAIPADFGYADIAGRTVDVMLQVLEVAEALLPAVDADFARSLGVTSGDPQDLRPEMRRRLADEFATLARAEVHRQLLQHLLAANPIPVPAVLVDQEALNLKYTSMRALVIVDPDKARPAEAFRPLAEELVRTRLLVDAIAQTQEIVVDQEEVQRRANAMIARQVTAFTGDRQQLLAQAEYLVLEEQAGDWLGQRAVTTPRPTSYRQLARAGASGPLIAG